MLNKTHLVKLKDSPLKPVFLENIVVYIVVYIVRLQGRTKNDIILGYTGEKPVKVHFNDIVIPQT